MFKDIDMNYMLDLVRQFNTLDFTQVRDKLMSNFINEWQGDLNREEAKTGPGKNKCHTYRVVFSFPNVLISKHGHG